MQISVGKQTDTYLVHFIPTDLGNGAVAFAVEKLDADLATVESYHVHLSDDPQDCSCTCKGATYCGHCKHLEGLAHCCKHLHPPDPLTVLDLRA